MRPDQDHGENPTGDPFASRQAGSALVLVLAFLAVVGILGGSLSMQIRASSESIQNHKAVSGRARMMKHVFSSVLSLAAVRRSIQLNPIFRDCVNSLPAVAMKCTSRATDDRLVTSEWGTSHAIPSIILYDAAGHQVTDREYDQEGNVCKGTGDCRMTAVSYARALCKDGEPVCDRAVAVKIFLRFWNVGDQNRTTIGKHWAWGDMEGGYDWGCTAPPCPRSPGVLRPYPNVLDFRNEDPIVIDVNALDATVPQAQVLLCADSCGGHYSIPSGTLPTSGTSGFLAYGPGCQPPLRTFTTGLAARVLSCGSKGDPQYSYLLRQDRDWDNRAKVDTGSW